MMFFKKKSKEINSTIISPLEGEMVTIDQVPDPVFAQKMIGDGFAIKPTNGVVVAPVDGKVVSVFPTKHAVSLLSDSGLEILIHVGLETVALAGDGFTSFVKDGQAVKQGQKLLEVDFDSISSRVPSIITPVVFTNLKEGQRVVIEGDGVKVI